MKNCFYLFLLLLTSAMFISCESTQGHARVYRLHELPAQPRPEVQVAATPRPASQKAQQPTQRQESRCISHSSFTYLPTYPQTMETWKDDARLKAKGDRKVEIDLASQRGRFIVNGEVAMDFPVCTGSADTPTPPGTYTILQKRAQHTSNLYHSSMPYFMRLTYCGIGLHVGHVARTPSSHGCIRMTSEACQPLFQQAAVGTRVVVR